jgi:hypothetical protein
VSFLLATLLAAAASRGAARADSASEANVFARGQQAVGRHPNKGIDMTFVLIGLTFFLP